MRTAKLILWNAAVTKIIQDTCYQKKKKTKTTRQTSPYEKRLPFNARFHKIELYFVFTMCFLWTSRG